VDLRAVLLRTHGAELTVHRREFLALTGATLLAAPVRADDFGDLVARQLALTHTPGMSVALVGHTAFSAGYGYADVETARRVTADTIFQIASVSKTVTATALMLLWQAGAFKLDDPIAPYLDFKVVNPKFADASITFRHLFTHTSSISDTMYDDMDFSAGDLPSLRDFLARYLGAPKAYADTKPAAAWSYSNVGAALLGYLGERLSGKPFDVLTRERIFAPLGMHSTSWRYEGVSDARLAQPYEFDATHFKRLPRARYPDWPAGLLCTSANDFAKFLAGYTHAALLKRETIALMFTPDPIAMTANGSIRQGLIWELANGGAIALHSGGDPGAAGLAVIDIGHNSAALAVANVSPSKDVMNLQKDVVHRLLTRA
jgi:CubicO group peptidase (beta-lactamase class C family)